MPMTVRYIDAADLPDAAELAALEHEAAMSARGRADFARGLPRLAPADVLFYEDEDGEVTMDEDGARAWYGGWDAANLAAPVVYEPSEEDPF